MAEIYLVRHGQASFAAENYDQLSDVGFQQSEFLGQYFADRNITFDHLFLGSQTRHAQTATGIVGALNKPDQTILPGLNEYDFKALYGQYMTQHSEPDARRPGQPMSDDRRVYYRRLKHALTLWSENKLAGELPESWIEFQHRVTMAVRHIQDNAKGTCLVVSSGGPISTVIGHVLALSPAKIIDLNLQVKNTSFSQIFFGKTTLRISNFNVIPHLDQQDRFQSITYS